MEILKTAMAGTLESSDAQVTVEPGPSQKSGSSFYLSRTGRDVRRRSLK